MTLKTKYFLAGERPVYMEAEENNTLLKAFVFNWQNGEFEVNNDYGYKIRFGRIDDVDTVSEDEFKKYVEALKKKKGFI